MQNSLNCSGKLYREILLLYVNPPLFFIFWCNTEMITSIFGIRVHLGGWTNGTCSITKNAHLYAFYQPCNLQQKISDFMCPTMYGIYSGRKPYGGSFLSSWWLSFLRAPSGLARIFYHPDTPVWAMFIMLTQKARDIKISSALEGTAGFWEEWCNFFYYTTIKQTSLDVKKLP